MSTRTLLVGLLLVIAAIVGWWAAYLWNDLGSAPIEATLFEEPRTIAEFTLSDQNGETFDRSRLEGRWSLVFFGFTNCPGVCPTTLATLGQVADTLDSEPAIVFVSVDPGRDDVATVAEYVRAFGEEFTGVTGESVELDKLAASFYVTYAYSGKGENYMVDHTTSVFLVDPDGRLKAIFSAPIDARQLASDLRRII